MGKLRSSREVTMPSKEQTRGDEKASSKQRSAPPTTENLNALTPEQVHPAAIVQRATIDRRTATADNVLRLQRTIGNRAVGQFLSGIAPQPQPIQRKEAKTGLPDTLKAGIENLSGLAMDDVQVHYNSDKPAGVQAVAFTEGTDIHVAPGQEQHLPHEAWHVVQQKQGKVAPSIRLQGNNINVDSILEAEADVMGAKASHLSVTDRLPSPAQLNHSRQQLGQPAQAVPRDVPGSGVRQFGCFGKGKSKTPPPVPQPETVEEKPRPDPNTLEGLTALMSERAPRGKKITPELMQSIWENEEPDPEINVLYEKYGLDVMSQLPYVREGQTFTAMVPPSIIGGLTGEDDSAKLDTIFDNQYLRQSA